MKTNLPRFVRYKGKCWYNPGRSLDHMGRIDLWSLSEDGAGTGAELDYVYPCSEAEVKAIEDAANAGQLIKFT